MASRASTGGDPGHRFHLALLPLRLFLGGMLLYAGIDKLLDPAFLHAAGAGSIGEQLQGFTHASPIAGLVEALALPSPVFVGLLVAVAEIAIGIATLTGLAYRLAAGAGVAISILFWLTASWETRPIYLGPDLPFAFGWLTLALAGHGDLYTVESWLDGLAGGAYGLDDVSPSRRALLQAAAVGVVAIGVGGAFGVLGKVLGRGGDDAVATTGADGTTQLPGSAAGSSGLPSGAASSPAATASGATASGATASGATASGGGGASGSAGSAGSGVLAKLADLKTGRAYEFQDPSTGDPAVIIRLTSSHVVAYDAVCTHQGCTVGYDQGSGLLVCPCHGAAFDPTHGAEVVGGPAPAPLTSLPLHIDAATGAITLKA
ncbi:MAG TPA: TQO small subunit DoxD [Candidatus Limnocylindrales bacterium]